jgi:hypothetical protein
MVSSMDKVADKLNPEHITTIIDNAEKEDVRKYNAFKMGKIIGLIIFLICIAFSFSLLYIFKDSPHFPTILTGIFSFLGGLGVGKFILPNK